MRRHEHGGVARFRYSDLKEAARFAAKKLNKPDCQKDLAALGVSADQIRSGAGAANNPRNSLQRVIGPASDLGFWPRK
jgi:hypothetical protein